MAYVYSAEKMITPITQNYANAGKSLGVASSRFENPENVTSKSSQEGFSNQFSHAVYGDGPYNLNFPNCRSEILAQNCDYLA